MADRIITMRHQLSDALKQKGELRGAGGSFFCLSTRDGPAVPRAPTFSFGLTHGNVFTSMSGLSDVIQRAYDKRSDCCAGTLWSGTLGDWSHILKQIGMFTFTGLNKDQVAFMTKEYHIYMTADG